MQNGKEKELEKKPEENDDIIKKCIGVFGKWHIWVCLIIFLVKFPVAWHQLSIVFLSPTVNFTCVNNYTDRCSKDCTSYLFDRTTFQSTIIMEWNLVCENQYLATMAQTITMLGILAGSMIFGYLSDIFGRKNPLVIAVIIQAVSGIAAAFSPWFWGFLLMRFLSALATGGTMITSFVLVMEIVGTEWRTVLCILYQIPFNLGHLLLPLIGYFVRDWRHFQAAISAPSAFLIIYYWLLPESPRWLLAVGKRDQAVKIMKSAAKHNKLPTKDIEQYVENYMQTLDTKETDNKKGNLLDLFRTPIIRMYTMIICFDWLVCGLCFFGVSQFIGQLGGDIFVNVALSAVIQVPSTLFACWSTKAWGRKKTLLLSFIVGAASLLLLGFVPSNPTWIKTTLGTIGMFGFALAFPTVYIYSGELFPTVVRNVGVGTCSMCARIGSMVAPFIAALTLYEEWIPPVIFGITPLVGAVLSIKLPETLDCKLPETVEEVESYAKVQIKKEQLEMNP